MSPKTSPANAPGSLQRGQNTPRRKTAQIGGAK